MNELCFVWGPPLSGQRRWMAEAARETEASTLVELLPLSGAELETGGDIGLILNKVQQSLSGSSLVASDPMGTRRPRHIYCELPWSVTDDDLLLEDWLAEQPMFTQVLAGGAPEWGLSFVAVCPTDAERLPESYRRGLEEFSRASHSSVMVLCQDEGAEVPAWLGTEILDFGPRIEVFEEPLWPAVPVGARKNHYFTNVESFEVFSAALHGEPAFYKSLMLELAEGQHGAIWGAEAYWQNAQGRFEAYTLSQGQLFHWESEEASIVKSVGENGPSLSVCGYPLRRAELLRSLQSQSFC